MAGVDTTPAGISLTNAIDKADKSCLAAIRRLQAWDRSALVAALLDGRRTESTLELTDEAWAVPVAEALGEALRRSDLTALRLRIVENLAHDPSREQRQIGT